MLSLDRAQPEPGPATVVTKATLRAAAAMGLSAKTLAAIIGASEPQLSRMRHGRVALDPASKSYELALLLIRVFRSLDAIVGGDEAVLRRWLGGDNLALGGRPLERMQTVAGLAEVLAYLDARRALV